MSKPRKKLRGFVQSDLADVQPAFHHLPRRLAFLDEVDRVVDWDRAVAPVLALYAGTGRPATDPLVLVKMMMLQRWFDLSDPQCELQCNDRLSFRRFVGLHGAEQAPDETTLVRFRGRLAAAGLASGPADDVTTQLEEAGLIVQEGRSVIVDGSLLCSQTNRRTKDGGGDPIEPDATTQGRSDNRPPVHGYKMHAAMDGETRLILGVTVTAATGDERAQLEELVLEGDKELLADKGYQSAAVDGQLRRKKVKNRVMRKKPRGGQLNEYQRRRNQSIAARRSAVESLFATLKQRMGLKRAIYRGMAKVKALVQWTAVAYNLRRLARLAWPGMAGAPARAGP
jgi:IS5 family transposase